MTVSLREVYHERYCGTRPGGNGRLAARLRAIEMRGPDRIPIVFWNRDQTRGDVMLYHLSLGMPGDGSVNAWDWSVNEWGYVLEKLGDGTMGHPVAPVYRELAPRRGDPRAGPAGRGADVGRARLRPGLRRPLPPGQPRSQRVHGLHAAARLRRRHAGFPARPGRICGPHGSDPRLRVRPDADRGPARLPRDPFCRRLGHAIRPDDLARPVAAAVQAPLRPAVRPGPRIGAARLVPLLRRVPARSWRISTRSAWTCSTSRSPT